MSISSAPTTLDEIGLLLFTEHIFSFEVTAFILLVAIIASLAQWATFFNALRWPGLLLAIFVGIYTAFLLTQAKGRDLWQNRFLPLTFLSHTALAGSATLLILSFFIDLNETAIQEVQLEVSDKAIDWIADKGYDKTMGARPMQRLIQEKIKKPLAEEILFGKFSSKGGIVYVDEENDEITLRLEELVKNKNTVS